MKKQPFFVLKTKVIGSHTVKSTITYRNDIQKLVFHSITQNKYAPTKTTSFDYDLKNIGASLFPVYCMYLDGLEMIDGTTTLDSRHFSSETVLNFKITNKMYTSMTDAEIQQCFNEYTQDAFFGWEDLLRGYQIFFHDIGFTAM